MTVREGAGSSAPSPDFEEKTMATQEDIKGQIAALEYERKGYVQRKLGARVKAVDASIAALKKLAKRADDSEEDGE